jgi:SNF family Na+-dependent transporter
VSLALVATGLGFGAYWQIAATQGRDRASSWALPLWLGQLAGGVLFAVAQAQPTPASQWALLIAGIAAAAFLLSLLRDQLKARQLGLVLQWFIPFAPVFVWILPVVGLLKTITILLALVVCAIYAIFSGWLMKVSHLRKALNFQKEGIYNLWRVAVRLVIPLAIIVALVGLVLPD